MISFSPGFFPSSSWPPAALRDFLSSLLPPSDSIAVRVKSGPHSCQLQPGRIIFHKLTHLNREKKDASNASSCWRNLRAEERGRRNAQVRPEIFQRKIVLVRYMRSKNIFLSPLFLFFVPMCYGRRRRISPPLSPFLTMPLAPGGISLTFINESGQRREEGGRGEGCQG